MWGKEWGKEKLWIDTQDGTQSGTQEATDDVPHESLLILLNLDFRNLLMLCNTYLQVTILPICAFLWVWISYRIFAPGNKKEYININ